MTETEHLHAAPTVVSAGRSCFSRPRAEKNCEVGAGGASCEHRLIFDVAVKLLVSCLPITGVFEGGVWSAPALCQTSVMLITGPLGQMSWGESDRRKERQGKGMRTHLWNSSQIFHAVISLLFHWQPVEFMCCSRMTLCAVER